MEFINTAQPDLTGVLNKHLVGCLNWRQSQIKTYLVQLFAQDSALLAQTLLIVLKTLYSEVAPKHICRGRSRVLIAWVSCEGLAGLRKETEINARVGDRLQ